MFAFNSVLTPTLFSQKMQKAHILYIGIMINMSKPIQAIEMVCPLLESWSSQLSMHVCLISVWQVHPEENASKVVANFICISFHVDEGFSFMLPHCGKCAFMWCRKWLDDPLPVSARCTFILGVKSAVRPPRERTRDHWWSVSRSLI